MRTRAYTRKMRAKHIVCKKRIARNRRIREEIPYYNFDGKFSKGKVHCSCCLCRGKDYRGRHIITKPEVLAELKMKEELAEIET